MANTLHDRKVRSRIQSLRREGFGNIKADIHGFEQPSPIGGEGFIPDIEATKRGVRRIEEVERESNLQTRRDQIGAFRRHAAQKPRTIFRLNVLKDK